MAGQLAGIPRYRIQWHVVEAAVVPIRKQAYESAQDVQGAMTLVTNQELKEHLRELVKALEGLRLKLSNPRSMF
jgi:hypothetical protein